MMRPAIIHAVGNGERGRPARCSRRPYLPTVAQIFNLPYRRFVIGSTLLAGDRWQVKNLRYGAARPSRNQYVPTTDEHGWTRIRESLSSSVLIRVHPWLKKSSRAATISGDTDRVQLRAKLNTHSHRMGEGEWSSVARIVQPLWNLRKARQAVPSPGGREGQGEGRFV